MADQQPEYLTRDEAAELLRLKAQTLACWAMRGCGPRFVRIGGGPRGRVVYHRAELARWADARTFSSTAEARMKGRG